MPTETSESAAIESADCLAHLARAEPTNDVGQLLGLLGSLAHRCRC